MDIQLNKLPYISFLWYQMEEQVKKYGNKEWKSEEEIRKYIRENNIREYRVIGHISAETAKKWERWNIGVLYVVSVGENYALCLEDGYVI